MVHRIRFDQITFQGSTAYQNCYGCNNENLPSVVEALKVKAAASKCSVWKVELERQLIRSRNHRTKWCAYPAAVDASAESDLPNPSINANFWGWDNWLWQCINDNNNDHAAVSMRQTETLSPFYLELMRMSDAVSLWFWQVLGSFEPVPLGNIYSSGSGMNCVRLSFRQGLGLEV